MKILTSTMNTSELFDFLPFMTEDERPLAIRSSTGVKVVILTIVSVALLWCSAMKFFIYKYIARQKIAERPFSVLVLVDQIMHHLMISVLAAAFLCQVRA